MRIELDIIPRKNPFIPIEAETITPATFLKKETDDITVCVGNREKKLSEVFDVRISGTAESENDIEIILSGDCSSVKRVGEYMNAGRISVLGNIGMHCGNFMNGGIIEINGDSDSWLGREMRGGEIICRGNTGNYCGSGYRGEKTGIKGGKITVMKDAGDYLGECMAGGEIIVHGKAGNMPGCEMQKGTITIYKDAVLPCPNMKGGICYILGDASEILPTFKLKGSDYNKEHNRDFLIYEGDYANRNHKGLLFLKKT